MGLMKFFAAALIAVVAADDAPAKIASGASCAKDVKGECDAKLCCGAVAKVGDVEGKTDICYTKPEGDAKVTFELKAAVEASADGVEPVVAKADAVVGDFTCTAAAGDDAAAGASAMTVSAAMLIAAATLLQ